MRQESKFSYIRVVYLLVLVLGPYILNAQITDVELQNHKDDTLFKKELRKQEKVSLKNSHQRNLVFLSLVNASLKTQVSFELLDGLFSANVGLEQNLGLPDQSVFFTGAYIYRATPRSGIYLQYYGINRTKNWQTEKELIFLADTIPSGLQTTTYFNTQVFSGGYLFSILRDPHAFLGVYFNVFVIFLKTGVKSDVGNIDLGFNLGAPLPNLGLLAVFKLSQWLQFNADVGFFSLSTKNFGGSIYDLDVGLTFKVAKFLGLSIAYQEFDVSIYFPNNEINTVVDYNFRGPSITIRGNF